MHTSMYHIIIYMYSLYTLYNVLYYTIKVTVAVQSKVKQKNKLLADIFIIYLKKELQYITMKRYLENKVIYCIAYIW